MKDTVVRFCTMLFELGFAVTFCPYQSGEESWWKGCMKTLWDQGYRVLGWNLQCYAGGHDNRTNLTPWLAALAEVVGSEQKASLHLMPGLAVASAMDTFPKTDRLCPSQVETTVAGWNNSELGGVFLWRYDALTPEWADMCGGTNTLPQYIKAIKQGMKA